MPQQAQHPKPVIYVVATPLGNLEDITLRALRILKEVDLIACEDTRQTQKLLNHFGVETRTISYHEHNEAERAAELVAQLQSGKISSLALVSDAGTPLLSDPGYRLVSLAVESAIDVIPIPGAMAAVAALSASGLPPSSFRFSGFLPAKAGQRRSALEAVRHSQETEIFYEAPHRLLAALEDVVSVLGAERPIVVARELTKVHEEFLRGPAGDLLTQLRAREGAGQSLRGEITLLIGKAAPQQSPQKADLKERLAQIMQEQHLDEKSALKLLAKETGKGKSELYRELQRRK